MKSHTDIISDVDRFPYQDGSPHEYRKLLQNLYTLLWEDDEGTYPIGYPTREVINQLSQMPVSIRGQMDIDDEARTVKVFRDGPEKERTRVVSIVTNHLREEGAFKTLQGWRDELWPVYGRKGELLFSIERAAVGLLGAMRYGVHMSAFVKDPAAPHGIRLWVAKRASNKATFPGMLDNTAAGGLMTDEDPFECIVREADEEASLPADIVRRGAKGVGTVTYIYVSEAKQSGESGFIQPECQWVYDLELSNDVVPKPKDGEVEEFRLCGIDQVKKDLADGRFKPNCALVIIDLFIRHGILTEEDEPCLEEIKRRMHRSIAFPGPHQSKWRRM